MGIFYKVFFVFVFLILGCSHLDSNSYVRVNNSKYYKNASYTSVQDLNRVDIKFNKSSTFENFSFVKKFKTVYIFSALLLGFNNLLLDTQASKIEYSKIRTNTEQSYLMQGLELYKVSSTKDNFNNTIEIDLISSINKKYIIPQIKKINYKNERIWYRKLVPDPLFLKQNIYSNEVFKTDVLCSKLNKDIYILNSPNIDPKNCSSFIHLDDKGNKKTIKTIYGKDCSHISSMLELNNGDLIFLGQLNSGSSMIFKKTPKDIIKWSFFWPVTAEIKINKIEIVNNSLGKNENLYLHGSKKNKKSIYFSLDINNGTILDLWDFNILKYPNKSILSSQYLDENNKGLLKNLSKYNIKIVENPYLKIKDVKTEPNLSNNRKLLTISPSISPSKRPTIFPPALIPIISPAFNPAEIPAIAPGVNAIFIKEIQKLRKKNKEAEEKKDLYTGIIIGLSVGLGITLLLCMASWCCTLYTCRETNEDEETVL